MEGASTNICYNLLDRNVLDRKLGDKVAFYWSVCTETAVVPPNTHTHTQHSSLCCGPVDVLLDVLKVTEAVLSTCLSGRNKSPLRCNTVLI